MNKVVRIILSVIAFGLILDSSSAVFRWTLNPDQVDVNKPGFIEKFTDSIVYLPIDVVSIVFKFVAHILEGSINMILGILPGHVSITIPTSDIQISH